MNISEPFIRRPVMTTLVMVTILFFGILGYKALPVSDLPNVDYPTIEVSASFPGANPTTMANTVATPLEREFMTVEGISGLFSTSQTGSSKLVLQFNLEIDIDAASTGVEAAINRAQPNLPKDLPYNPTYRKVNPSQTPILYLAVTSPVMTLGELYDYGNTYIGQRLSMVDGVSQVITYGQPYAARVQVDTELLGYMELGIDEVTDQIRAGNVDLPTGTLYSPKTEFTIDVDGQLLKAEGYNELVVRSEDGAIVKIKDIGRALDSTANDKFYLRFLDKTTNQPCVVIAIQKEPNANTVKVVDMIDKLLPTIKNELPSSLSFHRMYDKAESIQESVNDVQFTLIVAFALVVLIIFLTLGKALNTVIPTLALPLSIFGTFAIMDILGFSLDILSLLALTLSIGFLVDDAIVVLENNVRHVQNGENPFNASLAGSKEIGFTIMSMTLCLASVFIPMLFLGGVIGRLFREFAVTIVVAVLFSGFISLTLTPLLSSRFIPNYNKEAKKGWMERLADFINDKMLAGYRKTLPIIMHHRIITLFVGIISIFGAGYFFVTLPKDFLPPADTGFIQGFSESQDGTSPFEMAKYQSEITDIIQKNPYVEKAVSLSSGITTDNEGLMFLRLVPFKDRPGQMELIQTLMKEFFFIPGVNAYLSPLPIINLQLGTTAKALYQYSLTAIDDEALNKSSVLLLNKMKEMKLLTQVSSDLQIKQPQLKMHILRDRASDLKISASQIETFLTYAYSDNKISTINSPINQYDVIIETLPQFYKDPTVVPNLYVRSDDDQLVSLSQIVEVKEDVGPLTVNHLNGLPSVQISFNLPPGVPLGPALDEIEKTAKEILPQNVTGAIIGTAEVFQSSFANLNFLFVIMIFVIYIILGILYESFIHPITVMSALPPATLGGLFTLYVFGETLSLISFVGLIMLIGIVMKNGIMMVDFANQGIREEGKNAYDAIFDACMIRFRPIIMTTVSALMGAVPIALAIGGPSAQLRQPLGIVVVGGLIISQILTLYLTPVVYYYLEVFQEKLKHLVARFNEWRKSRQAKA